MGHTDVQTIQTVRIVAMVYNGAPLVISSLLSIALFMTRDYPHPKIDRRKVYGLIVMGVLWGLSGIVGNFRRIAEPVFIESFLSLGAQAVFDILAGWLLFEFLFTDRLGKPGER